MKKAFYCYAKMYLNQKQNTQNKKLSLHFNTNPNKSHSKSKGRTSKPKNDIQYRVNTVSSIPKEGNLMKNSLEQNKNIKLNTYNISDNNNKLIISAYEQTIISLFSYIKEVSEENNYKMLKDKFFTILERNLLQIPKDEKSNNKTSTLSSSNSIMSLLQESKNKCCLKQRKQFQLYQFQKNGKKKGNGFLSHKSLYSLSKPGKKVNSNSPEKQTINKKSFLMKFYSFHHKQDCYKINNKSNENQYNINNTLTNFSGSNIIKQLNIDNQQNQEKSSKNEDITEDKINQSHNSELLRKIKSSLDDNLKGFFDFSYESFLNKGSERENTMRTQNEEQK